MKFHHAKASLYKERVRKVSIDLSVKRSLTLGGSKSNYVKAYETNFQNEDYIRFEATKRSGIPISHLCQARELLNYNWEKEFQLYEWNLDVVKSFAKSFNRFEKQIARIFVDSQRDCLAHVLKRYKKNGRYSEEVEPLFRIATSQLNVTQLMNSELMNIYLKGFPFEKFY